MIMHVLKVGCRWVDCPKAYGPHKTIYNRFARWSERGIWQKIFEAVAASAEPPEQAALDSSHVKVHRCASGGKGGRWDLRFRALSREIATCHSSLGGEFGERLDPGMAGIMASIMACTAVRTTNGILVAITTGIALFLLAGPLERRARAGIFLQGFAIGGDEGPSANRADADAALATEQGPAA